MPLLARRHHGILLLFRSEPFLFRILPGTDINLRRRTYLPLSFPGAAGQPGAYLADISRQFAE